MGQSAQEFMTEFARQLIKVEPMKRHEVVDQYAELLKKRDQSLAEKLADVTNTLKANSTSDVATAFLAEVE